MSREKSAHHMVVQRMNSGRREKRPSIEGYIAGTLQAYGIRKGILGQVWARIAGMPGQLVLRYGRQMGIRTCLLVQGERPHDPHKDPDRQIHQGQMFYD